MNSRVLFYFNAEQPLMAACRIIEKFYKEQPDHKILVVCSSTQLANDIDGLLWRFKKLSFIPHALLAEASSEPVIISSDLHQKTPCNILFNLTEKAITDPLYKTASIVEIVSLHEESQKEVARQNFKRYRQEGYKIESIDLLTHTL